MQQLFSTFPAGAPGAALFVLRSALALLLMIATRYFDFLPFWCVLPLFVLGAALALGFLTQIAAVACAGLIVVGAIKIGGTLGLVVGLHGLPALALVLLGAGAYSIDARLFGRRVIVLEK